MFFINKFSNTIDFCITIHITINVMYKIMFLNFFSGTVKSVHYYNNVTVIMNTHVNSTDIAYQLFSH